MLAAAVGLAHLTAWVQLLHCHGHHVSTLHGREDCRQQIEGKTKWPRRQQMQNKTSEYGLRDKQGFEYMGDRCMGSSKDIPQQLSNHWCLMSKAVTAHRWQHDATLSVSLHLRHDSHTMPSSRCAVSAQDLETPLQWAALRNPVCWTLEPPPELLLRGCRLAHGHWWPLHTPNSGADVCDDGLRAVLLLGSPPGTSRAAPGHGADHAAVHGNS